MDFKIIKKYIDENTILQTKTKLKLNPNTITYICGCNGYGKSTLLSQIRDNLHRLKAEDVNDIYNNPFYRLLRNKKKEENQNSDNIYFLNYNIYSNFASSDNGHLMSSLLDNVSSNGEGLSRRLVDGLLIFKRWLGDTKDIQNKKFFFLLDDCDAGTSIDAIVEIKSVLNLIVKEATDAGVEYYIILPVNSYEFVRDNNEAYCIDACSFEKLQFKTYSQYKKYVLKTRKIKDGRYKEVK